MAENPKNNISILLLSLLFTVLFGMISIFLQHHYSDYKLDQLTNHVENNQQRIMIVSYIVEDLKQIETDFFRILVINNHKSQKITLNSITNKLTEVTALLKIIESGGSHTRLIPLNLADRDSMTLQINYQPDIEGEIIAEVISLKTMLMEIKTKIHQIAEPANQNNRSLHPISNVAFLRQAESYFTRANERANKLLYDSNRQFLTLRREIEKNMRNGNISDLVSNLLTIIIVLVLGGLISRKITSSNLELEKLAQELQKSHDNLEKIVAERSAELQRTHQQLLHSEKLSAIGRLSASIAHEINNPLFGVITILGGIKKREELSSKGHDAVELALSECQRVKKLIANLQDFNRPTPGRFTPQAINQLIDEVLLLISKEFKNQRLKIIKEYADDLPEIKVVADQIKQVLLNLLQNALAASPPNSDITITTKQIDNQLAISIKDQGCGITAENQPHIFEPFFTTKSEVKGTGLGLSVSFGIIKSHNGEIQIESSPNQGSTFTILLPIKREQIIKGKSWTTVTES